MSIGKNKDFSSKSFLILGLILGVLVLVKLYFLYYDRKDFVSIQRENFQIVVYSKTGCSYCKLAKDLLDERKVQYEIVDITSNQDLANKLVAQTGQHTVPYIFSNEKFIGGYTELKNFLELYLVEEEKNIQKNN